MKITIENTSHLTNDELAGVAAFQNFAFKKLDQAERVLREWFPDWFIHRGGHHVALHRGNDDLRVLIITD